MSFATYYISKEVFCSRKAVKEVCKERIGEEEEEKPCFLVCNSSFLFFKHFRKHLYFEGSSNREFSIIDYLLKHTCALARLQR